MSLEDRGKDAVRTHILVLGTALSFAIVNTNIFSLVFDLPLYAL